MILVDQNVSWFVDGAGAVEDHQRAPTLAMNPTFEYYHRLFDRGRFRNPPTNDQTRAGTLTGSLVRFFLFSPASIQNIDA
jgi:hypothetical protein